MTLPEPIPLEAAQARLFALSAPLPPETLPVEASIGRYLAQDLMARRTQPAADMSAMDGYAVHGENLNGPWRVVGESAAGHPFGREISSDETVRISTGALLPRGAAAVLLQENARREGDALSLAGADAATPRHIRRAGFDFVAGDCLLERGIAIGPAQLALAIAGGHASLKTGQLAKLCVIDSGDELSADPSQLSDHQIPASNGAMVAGMAQTIVANCQKIGPVADSKTDLIAAFQKVRDADVIVISGGASVGDHDLVRPALQEWGAVLDFWRIAIKPGKPLMVARKGTQIILGLPGNPVSSYVTAYLFLLPLLRHLSGACDPLPNSFRLPLCAPLEQTGARTEFLRAIMASDGVHPLSQKDSSALRTLASANALIKRQAGAPRAEAGETVIVYPLQNGGIA